MPYNPGVNQSTKQRRRLVPAALRTPAPGYAERYAAVANHGGVL